jgi:hypothetical protein
MHTDTVSALDAPVPVHAPSVILVTEAAAGKIRDLLAEEASPTAACASSCRAAGARGSNTD